MSDYLLSILETVLFAGAERPLALLAEVDAEQPPGLPGAAAVYRAPHKPVYLQELARLLDEERPSRLLLLPPFLPAEQLPAGLRRDYPGLGLHEIALQRALAGRPPGTRVGAILPAGSLSDRRTAEWRRWLAETATVRYLIDLRTGELFPGVPAAVKSYLLVAETGRAAEPLTRFFKLPFAAGENVSEARQRAALDDLRRLGKKGGGATAFGFVLRGALDPQTPWLYERHEPRYQQRLDELRVYGEVRPLGELVELWLGFAPHEMVNALLPVGEQGSGGAGGQGSRGVPVVTVPVVSGRELGRDGLHVEQIRHHLLADAAERYRLQVNDICLRSTLTSEQPPVAVLIREEMLPLAANQSVMVLRPKPEVNLDPEFLAAYLQSNHVLHSLRAQGVGNTLHARSLADVPVPVQDEELAAVLRDLRRATQTLGEWQTEAQAALQSLFSYESARDARAYVLETGRRVRQRERAAKQVDDLSYRLRAGLPHPLAYRWRSAEAAEPTLEGYREVLECAEAVSCFLATVALVLARAVDPERPLSYLRRTLAPRLTERKSGTSFGDWWSILKETADSKALRQRGALPFYEVARFLDNGAAEEALGRLKERRNDDAHGRGPKGAEIAGVLQASLADLRLVLEAAEFLSEYSLQVIEKTERDTLAGITRYSFRRLMGDHPIMPVQADEATSAELEAGSVYLADRTGELYLLRPFLTRQRCPTCGGWELFYLDQYDNKTGICTLKSLEQGHTVEDGGIAAVLRRVGMLG